MSWLLSKLTGGLVGSSRQSQSDNKYDDDEEEEEEQQDEQQQQSAAAAASSSPSSSDAAADSPQDYSQLSFPGYDELCRASIVLSRFRGSSEPLDVKSRQALLVLLRPDGSFDSVVHVYTSPAALVIVQPLTGALWYDVDRAHQSLLFGVKMQDTMSVFHCRFHDVEEEKTVALNWSVAVWEHAQQGSFTKLVKQTDWVDPMQPQYTEPLTDSRHEPDDDASFMDTEDDDKDDEEEDEEPEVAARHATPIRGFRTTRPRTLHSGSKSASAANDKLAVGIAVNRAFVGRGDVIGVFSHDNSGKLEFQTSIGDLHTQSGAQLRPTAMMLHEQDRKMVLLDAAQDGSTVYEMDIEVGKIVNEYRPMQDEDFKVRSVGHVNKYAERTGEETILAVNKNAVFSLDPRQHGRSKIARQHQYASEMKMSSVVSSGSGDVATGSEKGEIRLYNDISKQAKTRLPGLGDPIIGLDTTEDGKWILATTRYYLLLISTVIPNDAKSGWSKSMTNSASPPLKLQLSADDMQRYNITQLSFTTAHFNTGSGIREEWIITSAGPYIITWNFRRIKTDPAYRYRYDIKKLQADVVADQFLYGHKDAVVVTTANNVFTERKGKVL